MSAKALIIGAGPAGLMAAETLARFGHKVIVVESKTSVGRKFLMAGKSGLNLTKDEPFALFVDNYTDASSWLRPMLQAFGPATTQAWARKLGQDLYTGSTGRVFPTKMKASPLLRAWLAELANLGVEIRTQWRCCGIMDQQAAFETPNGPVVESAEAIVLAMGGASWARLGSDGLWADWIGVPLVPFKPANVGLNIAWSAHMAPVLGQPIKGVALCTGETTSRGEFVLSADGIQGGGVYMISRKVREGHALFLDLFPDYTVDALVQKISRPRGKSSLTNHLRKTLKLDGARRALMQEWLRPFPTDQNILAAALKSIPVPQTGLRPMDEAISTAGGVPRTAVTDALMLRERPGIFVAGEMLDWEAPTGGYLLTACLATGHWAGQAASRYLNDVASASPVG